MVEVLSSKGENRGKFKKEHYGEQGGREEVETRGAEGEGLDEKDERFGTYKEKDLDLHKKFTESTRKRKVRKEVEELTEKMGISKEVVQRAREQNILKEEDMVKPKKKKPVSTPPKQSKPGQSQTAPTSCAQKPTPPPKPQSKSTGGAEKRKNENYQREYVVATVGDETESDEAVKEVKKTATYARGVKKPQSGGAQSSARARVRKKHKSKLDEAMKSNKVEDQSSENGVPEEHTSVHTIVDDPNNANIDTSGEVVLDPLVIEVISKKVAEEIDDAEKGEDDGKGESVEVPEKEKGEKKEDQCLVTVARDIVVDK
ncbi:uncharacterized protein LOC131860139 [Cryptomeria japonica]|uniref:uncharacterized protein LOC131860139 n=1 Tax=Cryptomeria japonica TaxID=3369 RepID=UPI0027DAA6DA|nr:uncharacterized protein LOC131860139 [Cryptomeria japonica]